MIHAKLMNKFDYVHLFLINLAFTKNIKSIINIFNYKLKITFNKVQINII